MKQIKVSNVELQRRLDGIKTSHIVILWLIAFALLCVAIAL